MCPLQCTVDTRKASFPARCQRSVIERDMVYYSKAPIIEAVIDVQFSNALSLRELERLRDRFKKSYPSVQERLQVQVTLGADGRSSQSTSTDGFQLGDSNGSDLVLLLPQAAATIRLPPYGAWEKLLERARYNFDELTSIVGRRQVTRIATRFINRIDVPNALIIGAPLSKFFTITVAFPQGAVGNINGTSFTFSAQERATGFWANVNFSNAAPALLEHQSFLLDIDVYKRDGIDLNIDAMWNQVDELRVAKNNLFEAAITDEVRKLIA